MSRIQRAEIGVEEGFLDAVGVGRIAREAQSLQGEFHPCYGHAGFLHDPVMRGCGLAQSAAVVKFLKATATADDAFLHGHDTVRKVQNRRPPLFLSRHAVVFRQSLKAGHDLIGFGNGIAEGRQFVAVRQFKQALPTCTSARTHDVVGKREVLLLACQLPQLHHGFENGRGIRALPCVRCIGNAHLPDAVPDSCNDIIKVADHRRLDGFAQVIFGADFIEIFQTEQDILATPHIPPAEFQFLRVGGDSAAGFCVSDELQNALAQDFIKFFVAVISIDPRCAAHHFAPVLARPTVLGVGLGTVEIRKLPPQIRAHQLILHNKCQRLVKHALKAAIHLRFRIRHVGFIFAMHKFRFHIQHSCPDSFLPSLYHKTRLL